MTLRILLVEDSGVMRALLTTILEGEAHDLMLEEVRGNES